ncbi:aKG-HExxH-type peptide beta-hydroxylase [Actinomadura rupiterrae]|uniref:aKG-HExxH-type peptide beta-hydroxylase n=1 Tax=Actinomadura rupiterrae TaxID=559627 RepID=UPI0020A2FC00|nr:HEXXH motif-containing putative peptide modification protein [Actinomadura rupiterrae]MCP2337544.1 hypothetical protein [Actinomadura rupiterrae]
MDDLAQIFRHPPILRTHRSRAARIHQVLQLDAPPVARRNAGFTYAVAHHLLEGAEHAARSGDDILFTWYRESALHFTDRLASGDRIVLAPRPHEFVQSDISQTPYVLLNPDTNAADERLRDLVAAAAALGTRTGFGGLLGPHAPIVCLLHEKAMTSTFDSWTVSRLPGTLFTDYSTEPAVLTRDLIHEAGHNWLNDALAADGIKLDDAPAFPSPWKQSDRPAFGFLHACWAFPLTMIYCARILPTVQPPVHAFLAAYLSQQNALLQTAVPDHQEALKLIPQGPLRERLRTVRDLALKASA